MHLSGETILVGTEKSESKGLVVEEDGGISKRPGIPEQRVRGHVAKAVGDSIFPNSCPTSLSPTRVSPPPTPSTLAASRESRECPQAPSHCGELAELGSELEKN